MMPDLLKYALAGLSGIALGIFFFGGLHFTIRKGISSRRPALWFMGSFIVRVGIVLVGFYFISGGHWVRLLLALGGFILARVISLKLLWRNDEPRTCSVLEADNAS
jgi:F1F0 ATPase subunit 2